MKLDISIVSRISEQCNFDCSYCYMQEKKNQNMSLETIENIIEKLQNYNDLIAHFTWIGGEPLIRSDDLFSHIIEFSKSNNPKELKVSHSIQTNGFKLNLDRRKRLQDIGFKIGVSYDGSKELQNILRPNKGGKETYETLKSNLINADKTVGTITVITKLSYGKEREIYDELKSLTKSASLNFYSPTGFGLHNSDFLLPTKEEAKEMMIKFYEMWRDDQDMRFQLNPFTEIVKSFFTGINNICEYSAVSCYRIVGVDSMGHVFTCSRSTHIPETFMGDINHQNIEEILNSDPHERILDRYLKLKENGCKYFSICGGGCPVEAISYKRDFMDKTYYCCEIKGGLFKKVEEDLTKNEIREFFKSKLGI